MTLRSIVLLRHGEAENSAAFGPDHSRHLNLAGKSQVRSVSKKLQVIGFKPDRIYSSDALRATETLEIYREITEAAGKLTIETTLNRDLYNATEELFFEILYQLDNSVKSVIFVGHNPTWSQLSSSLTNGYVSMSPGNAAVLEVDLESWTDAAQVWNLKKHLKP